MALQSNNIRAVGEIEMTYILRVIFKDVRVGLVVGSLLALVNGIRVWVMYGQDMMLCLALGITIIAIVCIAKSIGCTLPLIAKRLGMDPAIMAAPLISTILDTCSLLVYFRVVTVFFHI